MDSFSYTHRYPQPVEGRTRSLASYSKYALLFAVGVGLGIAFVPGTATASRSMVVDPRAVDPEAMRAILAGVGDIKSDLEALTGKVDSSARTTRRALSAPKPSGLTSEEAKANLQALEALGGRIERLSEIVVLMNHQLAQPVKTREMLDRQEREPASPKK